MQWEIAVWTYQGFAFHASCGEAARFQITCTTFVPESDNLSQLTTDSWSALIGLHYTAYLLQTEAKHTQSRRQITITYQSFATLKYDKCPILLLTAHALAAFQLQHEFSWRRIFSHYVIIELLHSITNGLCMTTTDPAYWGIESTINRWLT